MEQLKYIDWNGITNVIYIEWQIWADKKSVGLQIDCWGCPTKVTSKCIATTVCERSDPPSRRWRTFAKCLEKISSAVRQQPPGSTNKLTPIIIQPDKNTHKSLRKMKAVQRPTRRQIFHKFWTVINLTTVTQNSEERQLTQMAVNPLYPHGAGTTTRISSLYGMKMIRQPTSTLHGQLIKPKTYQGNLDCW